MQIDPGLVEQLKNSLKCSAVLTPDSDGYAESLVRWSDSAERKAGLVVYVTSAEDISTTILFCRAHSIEIAVCGGKHSTSGTSSTTGLVIDLSKMSEVVVDTTMKTVTAQGGAVWKDVDEAAGEHGLAVVGGTVNHTGIGGLTLGGGYGWLSGSYGLVVDNLLKVVMVLADGRIVTASESENPDLFWAIRGAGQYFGAVVEFTYQAHEQKNLVWAGQMLFPADKVDAIVDFSNHLAVVTKGESALLAGIGAPPPLMGELGILVVGFYNGPKQQAEALFAPLLQINPIINTTAEIPYSKLNGIINDSVPYGGRKVFKGSALITPINTSFIRNIIEEIRLFHRRLPDANQSLVLFEIYNTSGWCNVPQTATAFANRGQHQNAMIVMKWADPANDGECRSWAREIAKKFTIEFERVKQEQSITNEAVGEYSNYDGLLSTNPPNIFGVNFERLSKLKVVFDPENVFGRSFSLLPVQ
ncbi:FAD-binding domain-containing protein [Wilcoxina mikolae CBS 423.85]|nr:FAD-binding domain-containing protein [Wilcoxina mikolae CBS 423.85]